MTLNELCTVHPHLWHMAEHGSWPSIRQNGLLSTSALLDLYGVSGDARHELESCRRPHSVILTKSGMSPAVIRDQKPLSDNKLSKCLTDGLKPADWYRLLNDRVFFWLTIERLRGLLAARAYRNKAHTVIVSETDSVVTQYKSQIELSPINSGAVVYNPTPRGRKTFAPIASYDYDRWSKQRRSKYKAIAELCVLGGVPDIRNHVLAVYNINDGSSTCIWQRKNVAVPKIL